jgi:anti-sigma factor RsiW
MGLLDASCAATSEALSDRLDGELRGLRRLRVGRHLARCARCRVTLASLVRLVSALRATREVNDENDGSLVGPVMARIQEGSKLGGRS